mmetsp:Transcript_69203/g.165940  ORF Transcript_69203/g.165940 Transcript_69203/m.165940 type:complete len:314 (+) Transcript_69203:122-1063(+)
MASVDDPIAEPETEPSVLLERQPEDSGGEVVPKASGSRLHLAKPVILQSSELEHPTPAGKLDSMMLLSQAEVWTSPSSSQSSSPSSSPSPLKLQEGLEGEEDVSKKTFGAPCSPLRQMQARAEDALETEAETTVPGDTTILYSACQDTCQDTIVCENDAMSSIAIVKSPPPYELGTPGDSPKLRCQLFATPVPMEQPEAVCTDAFPTSGCLREVLELEAQREGLAVEGSPPPRAFRRAEADDAADDDEQPLRVNHYPVNYQEANDYMTRHPWVGAEAARQMDSNVGAQEGKKCRCAESLLRLLSMPRKQAAAS